MMSDTKIAYPEQYYASYDTTATQPTIVTGWYDTWVMSSVVNVPDAKDMIPVTAQQWNDTTFRLQSGKGVQGGEIIDYTAPSVPIPLKAQATTALVTARAYVTNNYTMLNESTPDEWVAYLKALMAIENGNDTTSMALPTAPA